MGKKEEYKNFQPQFDSLKLEWSSFLYLVYLKLVGIEKGLAGFPYWGPRNGVLFGEIQEMNYGI